MVFQILSTTQITIPFLLNLIFTSVLKSFGNSSDLNIVLHASPWEFVIINSPNVDCALLNIKDDIENTQNFIPAKIIYPSK